MPGLNKLMELQQLTKIGDRLYFVGAGGFSYIEISQLENPVQHSISDKPVNRFYPSPDGQQIAVVTTEYGSQPGKAKSELLLLDPDGNPIGDHLETGDYFNRISWSRDQSKLAYVVAKQYPVKYEVHAVDLKSGVNKIIYKTGNQVQSSELFWSPNNKFLMFTLSLSSVEPKPETIIYKVK